jgi:prolyl 4-hydroxylase
MMEVVSPHDASGAESPRIIEIPNFLSQQECDHFIGLGQSAGMKPALLVGSKSGIDIQDDSRTNTSTWLRHSTTDVTANIVQRIADIVKLPVINAEQIQMIYYKPSEYYRAHYDGWKMPANPEERNEEERIIKSRYMDLQGGQRLVTCLVYLNEVEKGGATRFPNLEWEVQPAPGKLLVFWNVHEGTNELHPNSLHAGMPVEAGEKWAFNLWFREADARRDLR